MKKKIKSKHKPREGRPNQYVTAKRKSGEAGVEIRFLLRSLLPATVKSLVIDTELPLSTVYYHLTRMLEKKVIGVRKVAGFGRPINQYFRL